jgi:nucleotide-binding universal stress UspA family protein
MVIEGLQHILCPVDFSELSGLALRYADAFSKCGGATLTVLYANPFLPPPHVDSAQVAELEAQFRKWHAEAAAKLRTFVNSTLGADAAIVQTAVVEALPVDGIRAATRQLDASLVVVGTHGRSGVNRLMMGSVAERIFARVLFPCSRCAAIRPRPAKRCACGACCARWTTRALPGAPSPGLPGWPAASARG